MARDFGPFDDRPMYDVVNRRMQRAFNPVTGFVSSPVSGQGLVTVGTGAQLVIAAYPDGALIDGIYVENSTAEAFNLPNTNTQSTNPRIDRLVLRLDMNARTIEPFQIQGTPGASPQAPPLVRTATIVDMPLCQYRLPGSGSPQNPTSLADERLFNYTNNADDMTSLSVNGGWLPVGGHALKAYLTGRGTVRLLGWFQNGGPFTPDFTQFPITLPRPYWPKRDQVFDIPYSNGGRMVATVFPDGRIRLDTNGGIPIPANTNFFVDSVEYHLSYTGT